MYFESKPDLYKSLRKRVNFTLSYMKKGVAGQWAQTAWTTIKKSEEEELYPYASWISFLKEVRQVFGDSDVSATARHRIGTLRQGYSFWSLSSELPRVQRARPRGKAPVYNGPAHAGPQGRQWVGPRLILWNRWRRVGPSWGQLQAPVRDGWAHFAAHLGSLLETGGPMPRRI